VEQRLVIDLSLERRSVDQLAHPGSVSAVVAPAERVS
jgi:hypothetical protein